jgi:aryl-phospho-beta-D-glucosidase BglC (GH1 family)
MRRALKKVLGEEKYDHFFDRFLEYFFTEKDAAFFASLGLNAIRIPVNYRHFESDDEPGVWKEKGFAWLDRVINLCGAAGVFAVIDLHAAPGGCAPSRLTFV